MDERDTWQLPGSAVPGTVAPARLAADWRPSWTAATSPRRRAGVFAGVVVLHVALIAALLLLHGRERGAVLVPPIQVSMIDNPHPTDVPVVARPELERPPLLTVMPEVPDIAPAPDAPTAVFVAGPPPPAAVAEKQPPTPAEPVTPPRFDAAYLKNPPPAYPAASRRMREQGTVVLRVRVSADGNPAEVLLEHTSGSPRLDDAALAAVRHWRFVPAHRGSQAVEAWAIVPMAFEPWHG